MEDTQLAERHISLREKANLTQEQEAKIAGVSPTTISGIESGKITRPHLRTVIRLANALGVRPEELTSPKAESRSQSKPEERPFSTSTPLLRKHLKYVESWVQTWLQRIQGGDLHLAEADTMRMAAYLYRSELEKTVNIIDPMDEILDASERGEYVPEDLLEAAQKLANAIRGPRGLQAIPDLALQASRAFKDEDVAHQLRDEYVVNLFERRHALLSNAMLRA